MRRLFRLLLVHFAYRDRCPRCYGRGHKGNGWATVPRCPDCKGAGYLCWICGKPMKVICGRNYLSYSCHSCAERDHALFKR